MSGIIHFGSGKTLEITEEQFQKIGPKLRDGGVRVWALKDSHIIPLNSHTMEYVEYVVEDEEMKERKEEDRFISEPILDQRSQESKVPKTSEELLAEMTAKSNCKHEPEKLELYIQHTAKGIRYFPVCSFCGKRERYVSESKINKGEYVGTPNEKWTDKDIAHAKPWIED